MKINDFKTKYGLDGPLTEANDKSVQQKAELEANITETRRRQRIRLQKLQDMGYTPREIISPMSGMPTSKKELISNSQEIIEEKNIDLPEVYGQQISTFKRPQKSYTSIDEYIDEKVQEGITNRKIQKYQDYSVYVEGRNVTKNANPLPVKFPNRQDNQQYDSKDATSIIKARNYGEKLKPIYDRVKKFNEEQK